MSEEMTLKQIAPNVVKELFKGVKPFTGRALTKATKHKITKKAVPILQQHYPGHEQALTQDLLDLIIVQTKQKDAMIEEAKKRREEQKVKEKLDEIKGKEVKQ